MVQNIDYAATFLDFAGIEIPESMQGTSLLPLVSENDEPQWRNSIYYHYYEFPNEHMVKRHYGIRTERYKLIHFYNDIDTWELYDLETDPNEMNNIYDNPENEVLIADLKKQLTELQKQYKDTDTSTY
jgi:arylsulfatase A-like enzyme